MYSGMAFSCEVHEIKVTYVSCVSCVEHRDDKTIHSPGLGSDEYWMEGSATGDMSALPAVELAGPRDATGRDDVESVKAEAGTDAAAVAVA